MWNQCVSLVHIIWAASLRAAGGAESTHTQAHMQPHTQSHAHTHTHTHTHTRMHHVAVRSSDPAAGPMWRHDSVRWTDTTWAQNRRQEKEVPHSRPDMPRWDTNLIADYTTQYWNTLVNTPKTTLNSSLLTWESIPTKMKSTKLIRCKFSMKFTRLSSSSLVLVVGK